MPVTVTVTERIGTEEIVRCRTADRTEVTAVVPAYTLELDEERYLVFDPDDVHLFDCPTRTASD